MPQLRSFRYGLGLYLTGSDSEQLSKSLSLYKNSRENPRGLDRVWASLVPAHVEIPIRVSASFCAPLLPSDKW